MSSNVKKSCRCPCKDEVRKLSDGIKRLEKLASVQTKIINKIARQIHLDSDAEEDDYVAPDHSDNLCSIQFPITTEEGLLDLDNMLQDKTVHEQVVSVSYSYINVTIKYNLQSFVYIDLKIKQIKSYWGDGNTSAKALRNLVSESVLAKFYWRGNSESKALKDMTFFKQTLHGRYFIFCIYY